MALHIDGRGARATDGRDRIERQIEIGASPATVWALISEPGWCIDDGDVAAHRLTRDGDAATVHDATHRDVTIRTVQLDAPRYAAFRWIDRDAPEQAGLAAAGRHVT